ncbi:hypothetical protein SAMN05519103_00347 [Rhizobiales bacterium GAS113]|nr:hypothetical protein SAMN05519103_00347 [Rhizobiales bacterium GAS113]
MGQRNYTFDAFMKLSDGAAAYTASGIGQVAAANKILDLGGAATRTDLGVIGAYARLDCVAVIDISAIATVTDGNYRLNILGSNNANGSLPVSLACHEVGLGTGIANGSAAGTDITGLGSTTTPGRREILFCNEQNDITYEFVYLYVEVLGATSKSITLQATACILPLE